ncbi:MAG: ATP-binding protein [Bacteroidia bacterium]|nr:ATP-binding protein [Bacteroidia bacterium]
MMVSIVQDYQNIDNQRQFTLENRTGKQIVADRRLIEQLISNLLSNAIKYSSPDSEIIISLSTEKKKVKFVVKDHGLGMDKETVQRIFDKFFQAPTDHRDGLGLGLYLVKGIVEAHQGSIQVLSEPGVGSRFEVTLPSVN